MKNAYKKSIAWGILAMFGMALFYLVVMFLAMKSPQVVWGNFVQFWYLIIGLIIGFGGQIGLWAYVKNYPAHGALGAVAGVSGATSSGAMLACCAHHLADVLPILGLTTAVAWTTRYQRPILVLGLSINMLGIVYMLRILEKRKTMKC